MFEHEWWDFDDSGAVSHVIDKKICPDKDKVADFLIAKREVSPKVKAEVEAAIEEGWCAWQCRTDWAEREGEPLASYKPTQDRREVFRPDGRKKPGWFDVWIVRTGDWW